MCVMVSPLITLLMLFEAVAEDEPSSGGPNGRSIWRRVCVPLVGASGAVLVCSLEPGSLAFVLRSSND